MNYRDELQVYNRIVCQAFPGVRIVKVADASDEHGVLFGALGVPDEQGGAFSKFLLYRLPDELERLGVESVGIIPYSVKETRQIFPGAWKEMKMENAMRDRMHAVPNGMRVPVSS